MTTRAGFLELQAYCFWTDTSATETQDAQVTDMTASALVFQLVHVGQTLDKTNLTPSQRHSAFVVAS